MNPSHLSETFYKARRDPSLAVLEGFHPLKHALRFGAAVDVAVSSNPDKVRQLCETFAPDLLPTMPKLMQAVPASVFATLAPVPPESEIIAIARRPTLNTAAILSDDRRAPTVLLEHPSHMGNIGASVRVAAAAGASSLVVIGPHDPWHPAALRGAAGLQFAIPTFRVDALPPFQGPIIALHPEGEPLTGASIPSNAVLIFGSESRGISSRLLSRAHRLFAIPMEHGVSSLNLATSVAITLYAWKMSANQTTSPP